MMYLDLEKVLLPSNRIASGNDSNVFWYADKAIKEFHTVSMTAVRDYVNTMNECVSLINQINYKFSANVFRQTYCVTFKGVRVEKITESPRGRPVTISSYIPEPNLDWLTAKAERFSTYKPHDPDSRKQDFFTSLNSHFNTEHPTRLRDEFDFHTCILSRLLDFRLNTFGLYIGKYNVKLRPDLSTQSITLVVTDVAVYLPRVTRSTSYRSAIEIAGRQFESKEVSGIK